MAQKYLLQYICVFLLAVHGANAQCKFQDADESGQSLDLTSLASITLRIGDEDTPPHLYEYTPCRNALLCNSDTAMARRTTHNDNQDCVVMANWDDTAKQILPRYIEDYERWSFNYSTGNECNGRPFQFLAYFECDPAIGDYRVISAGSTRDNCTAAMYIDTKWACPGEVYTTQAPLDLSLSGGTIFIIIVFIAFALYFVGGYLCCAVKNRHEHSCGDYEVNCPHLVFWQRLPWLVVAGCQFSKEFMGTLCCDSSSHSSEKKDYLVASNMRQTDQDNEQKIDINENAFIPPSVDDEAGFDDD